MTLLACLGASPIVLWAAGKQPVKTNGAYTAGVGGYYTGMGRGTVGNMRVMIQARVTDKAGKGGNFVAPNLILDGDHFTGKGTVMGVRMTLSGRLDGYDQVRIGNFHGARLLCTYTDANGHSGRVAGVLQGAGS